MDARFESRNDQSDSSYKQRAAISALLIFSSFLFTFVFSFALVGFPSDLVGSYVNTSAPAQQALVEDPPLREVQGCAYGDKIIQGLRTESLNSKKCGTEEECEAKLAMLSERLEPLVISEVRVNCTQGCKGGRGYLVGTLGWKHQNINLESPYETLVAGEFCCRCS